MSDRQPCRSQQKLWRLGLVEPRLNAGRFARVISPAQLARAVAEALDVLSSATSASTFLKKGMVLDLPDGSGSSSLRCGSSRLHRKEKPLRSKLRGSRCFRPRPIGQAKEDRTDSVVLQAQSRPPYVRKRTEISNHPFGGPRRESLNRAEAASDYSSRWAR